MMTAPANTPPPAPETESDMEQTPPTPEETSETASLPIDFCGETPPKEGDVISVKVVSVDTDNGSFDVVHVPGTKSPKGGIKYAAAQFDQEGEPA